MRVVVLRKANKAMECGAPSPELVAAMARYDEEMRRAGVLISVERLQPSAKGIRMNIANGKVTFMDGPFTETSELIAGVNVLEVASREEAIAWMQRCPTLAFGMDADFEIRPVLEAQP